jgi:nucleoside-diphosphate-sugar epimerase
MHLVIGGHGLIGTALCNELRTRGLPFQGTHRFDPMMIYLDLRDPKNWPSISVSVVYLVAAIPGFPKCEGNRDSWVVNVDAPIALARHFHHGGGATQAFPVFLSSDTVEWSNAAYPRQKAQVEAYINSIDGAIIRPSKVAPERAGELAKVIVDVGLSRKPGVTRWS